MKGRNPKAMDRSSLGRAALSSRCNELSCVFLVTLVPRRFGREGSKEDARQIPNERSLSAARCPARANSLTIASQADLLGLKAPFSHYYVITSLTAAAARSARDLRSSCAPNLHNLLQKMLLTILLVEDKLKRIQAPRSVQLLYTANTSELNPLTLAGK